jgi:hypothetical protein
MAVNIQLLFIFKGANVYNYIPPSREREKEGRSAYTAEVT